ncbi:MAG: hypothetical protein D6820_03875 [Lentisphaerae bacterium]|nr:MAG: hypothetical protein D6820_03875 [Lentisphaerota bacterium]
MYGNTISYNRVLNHCRRFSDGGGIYTLGVQNKQANTPGEQPTASWSRFEGNFVDLGNGAGMEFYADEGSQFWKVDNCALAGGAWLVPNWGTRDIYCNNIYTGIGYAAGPTSDPSKNIIITNVNHTAWNPPDYTSPPGLAPIVNNSGVEATYSGNIPRNLALGRPVTLFPAGIRAANSVNGNRGDSFTPAKTGAGPNAYWQVDLGAVYRIDYVLLWSSYYAGPNDDTCNIKDFYVFVSDTPFTSDDPATLAAQPNVWHQKYVGVIENQKNELVRVRHSGRYVRIQLTGDAALVLNEVEVFENLMVDEVINNNNTPPQVRITTPANNSSYEEGTSITFTGSADDAEDGTLSGSSLVWTSDLDGRLGTGASITTNTLSVGTHVITLTATDSSGLTGTATVTITIRAVTGQGPLNTSNCLLWLDAAKLTPGEVLSTWHDKSTLGNDAFQSNTASQPSTMVGPKGNTVVTFDGDDDYFEFPEQTEIRTVFWVVRETDQNGLHFLLGHSNSYHFHRGDHGEIWHSVYAFTGFDKSKIKTYLNGQEVDGTQTKLPTGVYTVITLTTSDPATAKFLSKDRSFGNYWKGEIAEVIMYSKVLDNTTRQQIETYLKEKWIVEPKPPVAKIIAPADQASFELGTVITFKGSGEDAEDGTLTGNSLVWTSSIDGEIGRGNELDVSNLSVGTHTITLTVTDSSGLTATATVTLTVTDNGTGGGDDGGTAPPPVAGDDDDGGCSFIPGHGGGNLFPILKVLCILLLRRIHLCRSVIRH